MVPVMEVVAMMMAPMVMMVAVVNMMSYRDFLY